MTMEVQLRPLQEADIEIFHAQQGDEQARWMAAFTAAEPPDLATYAARMARFRADPSIVMQTILADGQVAGSVARYVQEGHPEVTYGLGREFWGRGIATQALALFLAQEQERPIFARAAADNGASLRVLEKCGFVIYGEEVGFAPARGTEIREYMLRLD